jgi:hypothetical protein
MAITLSDFFLSLMIFWFIIVIVSSVQILKKFLISKNITTYPFVLLFRRTKLNFLNSKFVQFISIHYKKLLDNSVSITLALCFSIPILLIIDLFLPYSVILLNNPIRIIDIRLVIYILIALLLVGLINQFGKILYLLSIKAKIKSIGIAIVAVIPLLFVESAFTKNSDLNEIKKIEKVNIRLSGPMMNLLVILLLTPIFLFPSFLFIPLYYDSEGAMIVHTSFSDDVMEQSLLGEIIILAERLNEFFIVQESVEITNADDFRAFSINAIRNTIIRLNFLSNESITIVSSIEHENTILGLYIIVDDVKISRLSDTTSLIPHYISQVVIWFYNFSIIFIIFNLLPLPSSEGKKLYLDLFKKNDKKMSNWFKVIQVICFAIVILQVILKII